LTNTISGAENIIFRHNISDGSDTSMSHHSLVRPWETNSLEKEFKIVNQSGRSNKILAHTTKDIFACILRQKPFNPVFKSDAKIT